MNRAKIIRLAIASVAVSAFVGAQAQSVGQGVPSGTYNLATGLDSTGTNLGTLGTSDSNANGGALNLGTNGLGGNGGHSRIFTPEPISMTLMAGSAFAGFLRMRRRKQA